jgi:hypothetical protein
MKKILFLISILSSAVSFAGDFDFAPRNVKPITLKVVEADKSQYPLQSQPPRRVGPPVWQLKETESLPLFYPISKPAEQINPVSTSSLPLEKQQTA